MRRFTVYSNNDIVRVADGLGTVADLEAFVTRRLGVAPGKIVLETASGERQNRMTVQQMAGLLTELDAETEEQGLEIQDVLPVIGCDPGATRRMYPTLAAAPLTGAVTCKTGTLTQTDGGVAVLAGTFTSPTNGPVVFAIAAPGAGGRLDYWRRSNSVGSSSSSRRRAARWRPRAARSCRFPTPSRRSRRSSAANRARAAEKTNRQDAKIAKTSHRRNHENSDKLNREGAKVKDIAASQPQRH